jgi:hypothetical protein
MDVAIVAAEANPRLPHALDALLLLDRTLHPSAAPGFETLDPQNATRLFAREPAPSSTYPDIIVDLSGGSTTHKPRRASARTLVPAFDGRAEEGALWSALLDERAPFLSLLEPAAGLEHDIGLPALETPSHLYKCAASIAAHLIDGIARALTGISASRQPGRYLDPAPQLSVFAPARFFGRALAAQAQRVLRWRLSLGPQWFVAWRAAPLNPPLPPGRIDISDWQILRDDGARYYADPFVIARGQRRYVFVEEFPYATGRGVLSCFEISDTGVLSRPRPVLERAFHLSYPHLIEVGSEIYLLPEASQSGRLTLYRADPFPDRWVEVAEIASRPLHDATIAKINGTYWMFATEQIPGGSSWDRLVLYSAPTLTGPWLPHPDSPVLLDARAARPAGTLFTHGGALWRPAQDCTGGYGSALTLARIDRLDKTGFAQTPVHTVRFGRPQHVLGPHTYNRGAGLEVLDVFMPRAKLTTAVSTAQTER